MSANEVIRQIEQLPAAEFAKVHDFVLRHATPVVEASVLRDEPKPVYRSKEFPAAMDRVFRENQELLRLLAQ